MDIVGTDFSLNSDGDKTSDVPGDVDALPGPISGGDAPEDTTVTVNNPALQAPEGPQVVFNRDGTVRRKPGRKPGQKTGEGIAHQQTATVKPVKSAAVTKAQTLTSEQLARLILKTSVGIMGSTVGPEWDMEREEADYMLAVTTAYIDAKGGSAMTPDAVLLLAIAGYAIPRTAHPNTREKLSAFFGTVLKGFKALFNR